MTSNSKLFILFLYKYLFTQNNKKNLLYRIFLLIIFTTFISVLIHSVTYGILKKIEHNLYNGYGEIYIKFKKKLLLKTFLSKKIEARLTKIAGIKTFYSYGAIEGALLVQDEVIPVSLLIMTKNSESLFFNQDIMKEMIFEKNQIYFGHTLYEKYKNNIPGMKILVINNHNAKKKNLSYQCMPINKIHPYTASWDEWNDRSILLGIDKFENYFELPSVEYIHVYTKNKYEKKNILEKIKKEFINEIGYICLSEDMCPAYTVFLSLLETVSSIIVFLVLLFSLVLLSILIKLYIYEHKNDYLYLILLGINDSFLKTALLSLFMIITSAAVFIGTMSAYLLTTILNYYKIIIFNKNNIHISFIISTKFILYYLLFSLLLTTICAFYFRNKYIKNEKI